MRPVIDVVLGVYLLGALCSLLSLCHMLLRCAARLHAPLWLRNSGPQTGLAALPHPSHRWIRLHSAGPGRWACWWGQ